VTPATEPAESSDAHHRPEAHPDPRTAPEQSRPYRPAEQGEHQRHNQHEQLDPHHRQTSEKTFADPGPRLIATDLDGTLLRDDKTISQRTTAALAAAEDAGVEVFFVTGRPLRWMGVVAQHLAGHGMAIAANGAAVYDLRAGTLIEAFPLPEDDALAIAHALRAAIPGTTFAVERTFCFRREPGYPQIEPDGSAARADIEELLASDREQPLLKLLAKHPSLDPDEFLATAHTLVGRHGEVTRSSESALLEISGTGVSKATTLAKCCAERGVTAAEVVAFGDMPNDLAMLSWAGLSYAVANAHPRVLAATTYRTESNNDDGVARVIERLLAARADRDDRADRDRGDGGDDRRP
jgi:Cof subfamily protein (haloacid dehalogenase superfamily)